MMEITFTLHEIEQAAKQFLDRAARYRVFAFSGDLGAGKTTFINAICKQLGILDTITSPTYAIIQQYESVEKKIIYHIDMYRIENADEAIEAGVEDCFQGGELCMVEWPERAILLFPPDTVYVSMETVSADTRKLVVKLPQ